MILSTDWYRDNDNSRIVPLSFQVQIFCLKSELWTIRNICSYALIPCLTPYITLQSLSNINNRNEHNEILYAIEFDKYYLQLI